MEALISVFNLGMALLIIGWLIQLVHTIKGGKSKKEINKYFPTMYGLGALVIAIDGFTKGQLIGPLLNLAMVILAVWVMVKIRK